MFSRRTGWDLTPNRFTALIERKRRAGGRILDLTESNPTRCGLSPTGDTTLTPLGHPRGARYAPSARGMLEARLAVADYYADRGCEVDPERIVLTASTSEAYGYLFKLLADDGDAVLVPRPSYPLFDYLARLEDVAPRRYPLEYLDGWRVDLDAVREACTPRTRAILAVSPNNPTGNLLRPDELAALDAIAAERGAALICDEVFADFPLADAPSPPVATVRQSGPGTHPAALTFALSGLSKVCGLPQVKLAWILLGGPDRLVEAALARLEVIADTYLTVATPTQLALTELLAGRQPFQDACRRRLRANRHHLAERLRTLPSVELLAAGGGWYACVRVPGTLTEEELTLCLLAEDSVAVHPGYFFDFDREAYLVLSLLPPESDFAAAVDRVLARLG